MEVQWKCSETTVNCTFPALVHCNTQQVRREREPAGKCCNHYSISTVTLQMYTVELQWNSGPPLQIFGKQDCHSAVVATSSARRHCRRRVLFHKIQVRPWCWQSCLPWRPWKPHVKTVSLKHSGLLYHAQIFAIHNTMQNCRWYIKPLYSMFTFIQSDLRQVMQGSSPMETASTCPLPQ